MPNNRFLTRQNEDKHKTKDKNITRYLKILSFPQKARSNCIDFSPNKIPKNLCLFKIIWNKPGLYPKNIPKPGFFLRTTPDHFRFYSEKGAKMTV